MANISYPAFFGRFFWYNIHLIAQNYDSFEVERQKNYKINQFIHTQTYKLDKSSVRDDVYPFKTFLKLICGNLPCPGCSIHANQYIIRHDPNESKDQEFAYTVEFHNSVNKRTSKISLSLEEARKHTNDTIQLKKEQYALSQPKLQIPVCEDFWTMLIIIAYTYSSDPESASTSEQIDMFDVLKYCLLLHPSTRTILDQISLSSICNFQSRVTTLQSLLNIHNQIARLITSEVPLGLQEFLNHLHKHINYQEVVKFDYFVESRNRDHQSMLQLQNKVVELQNEINHLSIERNVEHVDQAKHSTNTTTRDESGHSRTAEENWRAAFIVVLVLLLLMLTWMVWQKFRKRR